jgi:predicted nucleic acid-binding protein
VLLRHGLKKIDALHVACAIVAGADFFLTTDDGILKKAALVHSIQIYDLIGFIKEALA